MTFDEALELPMASALTDLAETIVGQHADYFTDFHSGQGPNLLDVIGEARLIHPNDAVAVEREAEVQPAIVNAAAEHQQGAACATKSSCAAFSRRLA